MESSAMDMFSALSGPDRQPSEAPAPGQIVTRETVAAKPTLSKLAIRYFVANMSDAGERMLAETIMTRSLESQGGLSKVGDIMVITENQHFTKEGDYIIAIKYAEMISTEPVADRVDVTEAISAASKFSVD